MQFNTWGIGRRDELARDFDPDDFPFIERVRVHLDLALVEIRGNGEPVQIALGEQTDKADPEAVKARVTPFFSSFDALDFFCRMNLQQYLAVDRQAGFPRHWFWDDSRSVRPLTFSTGAQAIRTNGRLQSTDSDQKI